MNSEEVQQACKAGDLKTLQSIVKSNPCSLNALDPKLGWSPLYRCIVYGIFETAMLLQLGANPNIQNRLGQAPLHQASETNQISLLKLLLRYKADPNVQQNDGDTPLHISCYKGHFEIVQILLAAGANPNLFNTMLGRTPLHYASECAYVEITKELLLYRADVTHRDKNNLLASDLASDSQILEFLREDCEKKQPYKEISIDEETNSKESIHEPESEKAMMSTNRFKSFPQFSFGDAKKSALFNWLLSHRLENVYESLQENGFDDLDQLMDATKTNNPLTEEILQMIGIKKVGYRLRLLSKLEEQCVLTSRYSIGNDSKIFWCANKGKKTKTTDLPMKDWLRSLNLAHLSQSFVENGFEDMDQIMGVMNSSYPITDLILENELGVEKIGHRHRILSKLSYEKNPETCRGFIRIDKAGKDIACESCTIV